MRRTSLLSCGLTLMLTGCRVPGIPNQPTRAEYAVYKAWLDQISLTLPTSLTFAVDDQTLTLHQSELQFQQCLPPRMEGMLEDAPSVNLISTSGNEWLKLADGRRAQLLTRHAAESFDQPVEWIRLSRVAFTLSGYDAYLWVESRTCGIQDKGCGEGHGTLLHGRKASGIWSFEETVCSSLMPSSPPEV